MNVVVPLFLLAPLILVPLGYRLLEGASPGSRPPALALRLVVPAAGLLVVAFWIPAGPVAAVFALPWVAVTSTTAAAAGLRWLRDPDPFRPDIRHATDAAVAFLAVGAVFALTNRLGIQPFGFSATIILLTAVHFHFAGFVLPLAGALAWTRRPSRWLEAALGAVVIGIPITALGFLGLPLANWTGAVLTATGGFGIGLATLAVARRMEGRGAALLGSLAGGSLLIGMPLAVIYATGTLIGVAWLDVGLMARVHGGLNAIGFALPAMVAWTLDRRSDRPIGGRVAGAIGSPTRRWSFGLVIGAVFGFGVLVGGTMVGALGLTALAMLAWERGRAAPVGGALIGLGAMWVVLFGRVELTCETDCVAPGVTMWITVGAVLVAIGAALSLYARRRARDRDPGATELAAATLVPARDPRPLGFAAAGIIAGYACVVGFISANAGAGDLGPPVLLPRPLVIAGLLMVPAAIAAVAAWRRSRRLLVIAGVMCLFQSFVSFAGVTLPFLLPAGLLIALGVSGGETAPRRAAVGGLAVIALWMGAWIATFALTETVCWVARTGANGALVYSQIPVTDTYTMGLDEVAQGCDGGVVSVAGVALAVILAIGAIAVAELSSRPTRDPSPIEGGPEAHAAREASRDRST